MRSTTGKQRAASKSVERRFLGIGVPGRERRAVWGTAVAPGGISGQGKAPCAQFFAGWWDAFPDARVDVRAVHIAGDIAVEEGTFTGTYHGTLHSPAGDIVPTDRPVAVDYIHVLRYRDGKHTSFNLLFDRLQMLEQLGLIPAPAPAG
jgi:hypothetical protein